MIQENPVKQLESSDKSKLYDYWHHLGKEIYRSILEEVAKTLQENKSVVLTNLAQKYLILEEQLSSIVLNAPGIYANQVRSRYFIKAFELKELETYLGTLKKPNFDLLNVFKS